MRELTLLETGYLCGGLVLSLVLPLMTSFRPLRAPATKRAAMKTVWTGQSLLAAAGLTVLASAPFTPYAAAFGSVGFAGCALVLFRQVQTACDA